MKHLLLIIMLASLTVADTFSITGFAFSKEKQDHNKDHNWIGLKLENENNYSVEIARFKNSFYKTTKILAVNKSFYPIEYKKLKIGATISLGVQKGYCTDKYKPTECKPFDKDKSLFIIPSFIIKYGKVGLSFMKVPDATVGRFELEVLTW